MKDREKIEQVLANGWVGHHPAQKAIVGAFRSLLTDETTIAEAMHILSEISHNAAGIRHDLGLIQELRPRQPQL